MHNLQSKDVQAHARRNFRHCGKTSRMKMHEVRTLHRDQWNEPNLLNL